MRALNNSALIAAMHSVFKEPHSFLFRSFPFFFILFSFLFASNLILETAAIDRQAPTQGSNFRDRMLLALNK